jgi:putative phage-type endonuclease
MTAVLSGPVAVCGWGSDEQWLAKRRRGISASDVSAVLGFGPYATPWEVWADKTGVRTREVDAAKEAIRLGVALEPWLLRQAGYLLGTEVQHTPARLYAHGGHRWRLASPDGETTEGTLVEGKTAGLASGHGVPDGWTDTRVPLGYEMQIRWQMHVMNRPRAALIALVAGLGLRVYPFERDLSVEADMVAQVAEWRQRHLIQGVEPPMGPRDNALMDDTYPHATDGPIRLDDVDDLVETVFAYQDGLAREAAGRAAKEAATARLKRLMGAHTEGTVDGRTALTWNAKRGAVDYPALVEDLIEIAGWDGPLLDMEELLDRYRRPDSRSISIKGL